MKTNTTNNCFYCFKECKVECKLNTVCVINTLVFARFEKYSQFESCKKLKFTVIVIDMFQLKVSNYTLFVVKIVFIYDFDGEIKFLLWFCAIAVMHQIYSNWSPIFINLKLHFKYFVDDYINKFGGDKNTIWTK